ncbi:MAG: insulinase family protein [Duncaniella sp.]|nr:insulinase family protein [Duncaniella sp.]
MSPIQHDIFYSTLPSGLRIVAVRRDSVVEHCGVAVNVGSRDESSHHHGLAHFVEHTIFKGTRRRRAWHILNRMELVGGELNAYTTKEETLLYSTFPTGNLERAVELISDLVIDSKFPQAELDRERDVVADEIESYLDTPSEGIFDLFEEEIFTGSPLAHNILGDTESIKGFDSIVCREYLDKFYTSGEIVFFYSGSAKPEMVERLVDRYFAQLTRKNTTRRRVTPAIVMPFCEERKIDTHQAHTVMGARVGGLMSDDRFAIALLTNILGGPGMNSLLNVELRERRGLVYTVDAGTTMMSDTGLFTIYFGCDADDVNRCVKLVDKCISRLADEPVTPRKLAEAKKQYAGQLTVASVNSEQTAISLARSYLYRRSAMTAAETIAAINAVSSSDLQKAAQTIRHLSRLTLI